MLITRATKALQAPSRCCRAVDRDRPAANDRPAI